MTINHARYAFCCVALIFCATQYVQQNIIELSLVASWFDSGRYWLLVTGGLVHSNTNHMLMNLSGLAIFLYLYRDLFSLKAFFIISFAMVIGVNAVIYFAFRPDFYMGFSGALYGLMSLGSLLSYCKNKDRVSLYVFIFILVKNGLDILGVSSVSQSLINMPVYWPSHVVGILLSIPLLVFMKKTSKTNCVLN